MLGLKTFLTGLASVLFCVGTVQSDDTRMKKAMDKNKSETAAELESQASAQMDELKLDDLLENDNVDISVFELSKLPAPAAGKKSEQLEKVKAEKKLGKEPALMQESEAMKVKRLGKMAKDIYSGEIID